MDGEPRYQVAVYNGDTRTFHPEGTWSDAVAYAARVTPDAAYVAVEQWVPTANACSGGWILVDVIRDHDGITAPYAALAA